MNTVASQANCPRESVIPAGNVEQEDRDLPVSRDEFFAKCRMISESGQQISAIFDGISQFKKIMSNVLNRDIITIEELRSGFDEIKPLLDFWTEYGEKFKSLINSKEEAQQLFQRYNEYPELKEKYEKLNSEIKTKKHEDLENAKKELDRLQTEQQRLSAENEDLNKKFDQAKNEKEITNKHLAMKAGEVEKLRYELTSYQIIRGLIADAFKIDARTESEFTSAINTTKEMLRTYTELGENKTDNIKDILNDAVNELVRENARVQGQNKKMTSLNNSLQQTIKEKDATIDATIKEKDTAIRETIQKKNAAIYEQEQKFFKAKGEITDLTEKINAYKQSNENLSNSLTKLQQLNNDYAASLAIRKEIIQCFKDVSDEITIVVNAIEGGGEHVSELQKLKEIFRALCIQNNRMADVDELARVHKIAQVDLSSMQEIFTKFKAFDVTKQSRDAYLDFINGFMQIRGMQWSASWDMMKQQQLLETFAQEYKRTLMLCRNFEDFQHAGLARFDLERLEGHQTEMFSAVENFYQHARKSTNEPSLGNGTTLYEKILSLPDVQAKLSSSIESAVFSINYSKAKIEELHELQKALNDLQLKCEKQGNVLNMLETKLYPEFMTAQNLGRRDKLLKDIEFGLANGSAHALLLTSYLGLLGFAENNRDTLSDETLIWILQQIPKAMYIFYQNTIIDGETDISSDEAIYNVMNQLMNKINKFILKGDFFLSMPRLGAAITLDSMEGVEATNIVNAVVSWMISDSHHKIIYKALVK